MLSVHTELKSHDSIKSTSFQVANQGIKSNEKQKVKSKRNSKLKKSSKSMVRVWHFRKWKVRIKLSIVLIPKHQWHHWHQWPPFNGMKTS